ncbi:PH domain-containing protein [Candidatus Micrarchaeota archaeon]|nr:PH domain-containing protein [Candidatus Micrarchaeota archaeon]
MTKKGKVLWEGKPSEKLWIAQTLLVGIPFLVLIIIFWAPFLMSFVFLRELSFLPFIVGVPVLILVVPLLIITIYFKALFKTYRYWVDEEGVNFQGGIFYRRKKFVPYYKITNVDVAQTFVDIIFGIYRVNIQTAGIGLRRPEISFLGLGKDEAEEVEGIIKERLKKIRVLGD